MVCSASASTCSCRCARCDVLELERLLVQLGRRADAGELPRGRRRRSASSSRSASPSSVWCSTRKCPPQLSSRCSASRHSSSPNSRKSATRPAFSSDWLSDSSSPRHAHVGVELLAQRAGSRRAPSRGSRLLRAMPQLSHRILPSSRWNQSTECVPLTDSSAPHLVARPRPRPRANAGSSVGTGSLPSSGAR